MNSLFLILSRKRYFAPAWVFASLNIMIGTWVLYIPRVKEKLGIDDGDLGVALFCMGLGSLVSLTVASRIIKSMGVGKATVVGVIYILTTIFNAITCAILCTSVCFLVFCRAIFLFYRYSNECPSLRYRNRR